MSSVVVVEISEGIMTLRLNRPEVRNALNAALRNSIHDALNQAAEDPAVRVIILTGNGASFCAGADISEFKSRLDWSLVDVYRWAGLSTDVFLQIQSLGKPVIAQVNGYALAGGCGLAIACDLVIASDRAEFGFPEIQRGFVAAVVMVQLSRLVGRKQGLELLMLGRRISSMEAKALGMVNRVVPHDTLEAETRTLARDLAAKDPFALQLTKDLYYTAAESGMIPALQAARTVNVLMRQNRSFSQGVQNFVSKRE